MFDVFPIQLYIYHHYRGLKLELVLISYNFLFQDVLIRFLTTDDIKLNIIDAEDPEVGIFIY